MSKFRDSYTPEQAAFCESIAPRIASFTEQYFLPGVRHPFMSALSKGGVIEEDPERDTDELEGLVITKAHGFRDTFDPEKWASLVDMPEEVVREGLMWVVMTDSKQYHRDNMVSPAVATGWSKLDHSFTYWDGERWHASRLKDASIPAGEEPWESMWETSSDLKPNEVEAIRAVAQQTKDVHDIANLFGEDSYLFERLVMEVCTDEKMKRSLGLSSTSIYNLPSSSLRRWMKHHQTAYQQLRFILPVAHKLVNGRSFELDSGGLIKAEYHRSSLPSTSDMLKDGENIAVNTIHPPVPSEWLA